MKKIILIMLFYYLLISPVFSQHDLFELGIKEYKKGNYNKAIKYYTKAIEIDPTYANAYFFRGSVYHDLKDYEKAINDYAEAIEIGSKLLFIAYYSSGVAYYVLEDNEKAINNFTKAIELNPNNVDANLGRGFVYDNLKEYEKAITDFTKAIELDPNNGYAYKIRGSAFHDLKDYEKAIYDYIKSIEINPKDVDVYLRLAIIYFLQSDNENAKKYLNDAITVEPRLSNGMVGLRELEKMGRIFTDEEKSELEKLFELIYK